MVRRQFKIIQYMYFTAIASLVFAVIFSPNPQNVALGGVTVLLLSRSPIFLPLLPRSPESRLLHLPEDPDERIAVLERIVARPLWLASARNARCASSSYSFTESVAAMPRRSIWADRPWLSSGCRRRPRAWCASKSRSASTASAVSRMREFNWKECPHASKFRPSTLWVGWSEGDFSTR